jgi:hypothetical protein
LGAPVAELGPPHTPGESFHRPRRWHVVSPVNRRTERSRFVITEWCTHVIGTCLDPPEYGGRESRRETDRRCLCRVGSSWRDHRNGGHRVSRSGFPPAKGGIIKLSEPRRTRHRSDRGYAWASWIPVAREGRSLGRHQRLAPIWSGRACSDRRH